MNKFLSTCLILFILPYTYSQTYSYSFSGKLDSESIIDIEQSCIKMTDVTSCKARVKKDSDKGEIIIVLNNSDRRAEADNQFKAKDIKELLLENGLLPINFMKIKD